MSCVLLFTNDNYTVGSFSRDHCTRLTRTKVFAGDWFQDPSDTKIQVSQIQKEVCVQYRCIYHRPNCIFNPQLFQSADSELVMQKANCIYYLVPC
jgi:hypothetical protein